METPSADPIERGGPADVLVLVGFAALLAPMIWRLGSGARSMPDLLAIGAALLLGIVATDLTSGVVHWFCDTFFAADTPVIGRVLIEPFREHHVDPLAMTRRDFFCTNRTNLLAMSAVLLLVLAARGAGGHAPSLFADAWWLGFAVAVALTNELHKLAHAPRAHHARHHDEAHGRSFCVTTGWLNPLLDRTDVFGTIERWTGRR
jgi:ubiquitin-conjugating enzyme E2 variant